MVQSDGSYTYTPGVTAAENNALIALGSGNSDQDVFTYAVSDGDGATAQANLTVTVTGATVAPSSVTGITLGSALLDGSTPSTTITVNFSEKVTDFVGSDLVLPAGVTLSNGVLAANGLSFTATLTAGANIADETRALR